MLFVWLVLCACVCIYIYIYIVLLIHLVLYIYIYCYIVITSPGNSTQRTSVCEMLVWRNGRRSSSSQVATANLRKQILNFRGFDSSRILIVRGGMLMPIGNFPEIMSQGILAGIILAGRLGVEAPCLMSLRLRLSACE